MTIKQMQLIGAKNKFISKPYILQAVFNGFIGSILAVTLIQMVLQFLWSIEPEIMNIAGNSDFLIVYLGLILVGVLISVLSTWQTVARFLRTHRDDLI